MTTTTLVPGLLVSLKTSIRGNVSYFKTELEAERVVGDGSAKKRWETERTISDPAEHEAGGIARSKARTAVARICIKTQNFGLLCPQDKVVQLEAAIAEARKIASKFNATAKVSTLGVYVITGTVASDDYEAIKSINSEIRDLLDQMADGVNRKDVATIRESAGRAKQLGNMLSTEAAAKVQVAIDAARGFATQVKKDGEAAVAVDQSVISRVRGAAALFMDGEPLPDAPSAAARTPKQAALDMGA